MGGIGGGLGGIGGIGGLGNGSGAIMSTGGGLRLGGGGR
jgi:hypothetical protein